MNLLFSYLFTASLLFACSECISYGKFISIKESPYFVCLLSPDTLDYEYFCDGSIISEYWIITAAHCFDYPFDRVLAGESIKNDDEKSSIYEIEKAFVHGSYAEIVDGGVINDIALIKLKRPIEFNESRQPIKIRKIPPRINDTLVIMGLGLQGDAKNFAPVLRQSEVQVGCDVDDVDVMFCAGDGSTDVCAGDSGGPGVIDGQLAGLVSFGPTCTAYNLHSHTPGFYTRVDKFYDWIVKITGIEL